MEKLLHCCPYKRGGGAGEVGGDMLVANLIWLRIKELTWTLEKIWRRQDHLNWTWCAALKMVHLETIYTRSVEIMKTSFVNKYNNSYDSFRVFFLKLGYLKSAN